MQKKHIIIGAGISGISLAHNLKKLNPNDEVIIFDKNYEESASFNANMIFITKHIINRPLDILYDLFELLHIENFPLIWCVHFMLVQLVFFWYSLLINNYFSSLNFMPIERSRCNNTIKYDIMQYRNLVRSFQILKKEFESYTIDDDKKIVVNGEFTCDFLYICTALPHTFTASIGSDVLYVKVDKVTIDCLIRDGQYWMVPLDNDIVKISFNIYVNMSLHKTPTINDNVIGLLERYGMKYIETTHSWAGDRSCSLDLLPYYFTKNKNVYVITGGSFLGFNTLPAISAKIAYIVNNKKIPKNLTKYDLSVNRIRKELGIIYIIMSGLLCFKLR